MWSYGKMSQLAAWALKYPVLLYKVIMHISPALHVFLIAHETETSLDSVEFFLKQTLLARTPGAEAWAFDEADNETKGVEGLAQLFCR